MATLSFLSIIIIFLSFSFAIFSHAIGKQWLNLVLIYLISSTGIGLWIFNFKLNIFYLTIFGILFFYFFRLFILKISKLDIKILILVILLNLSLLASGLGSDNVIYGFNGFILMLMYQIVFYIFYKFRFTDKSYSKFKLFCIVFLLFQSILGILQFTFSTPIGSISNYIGESVSVSRYITDNFGFRARGTFPYDTAYSLYLICFIPMTFEHFKDSNTIKKIKRVTFYLAVLALILSATRSGWIGFIAGLFYYYINQRKSSALYLRSLFAIGAAVLFALITPIGEIFYERIVGSSAFDSSYSRLLIQSIIVQNFEGKYLFGTGWNGYIDAVNIFLPQKQEVHIHNFILMTIVEFGLIASFLLFMIYKNFHNRLKIFSNNTIRPERVAFISALVANLFDWTIFSPLSGPFFWSIAALMLNQSVNKTYNYDNK